MKIDIREYREKDRKQIEQLMDKFFVYFTTIGNKLELKGTKNYGKKYIDILFQKMKLMQGKTYVAIENETVIGFIMGVIEKQTETDKLDYGKQKYGVVWELFVDEEYRKTGIGKKLIQKMEEYFKKKKCTVAAIQVLSTNKSAYKFYTNQGYEDWTVQVMKQL